MFERVTFEIDGKRYRGWKGTAVRRSVETLCGSFNFVSIDRWAQEGSPWPAYPGKECRINVDDDSIMLGYVDSITPTITGTNHEIQVSGRDRTADLVDCSAPAVPGTWNGLTLFQLAKQLTAPFGITAKNNAATGARYGQVVAKNGDTVFSLLSRLATQRNVLLVTDNSGNLSLENPGGQSAHDQLRLGQNLLSISGTYDYSGRFSEYQVRGQARTEGKGWSTSTVSVVGEATDAEITRHRPKIIRGTSVQTRRDAIDKAKWEANMNAARSVRWTCRVKGFYQSNGELWDMNMLIPVSVPEFRLESELLSVSVEYSQDNGGSYTTLELARPDAYQAEPVKTVKAKRDTLGWS